MFQQLASLTTPKVPISDIQCDNLCELARNLCLDQSKHWEFLESKYNVTISKAHVSSNTPPILRGSIHTPANPYTIFKFVSNIENRTKWDKVCSDPQSISINPRLQLLHLYFKSPTILASDRDITFLGTHKFYEDGSVVIACQSALSDPQLHPSLFHAVPGAVRAKLYFSGILMRPSPDGNGSILTYLSQSDPAGWVPTYLIDKFNSSQPMRVGRIHLLVKDLPPETRASVDPYFSQPLQGIQLDNSQVENLLNESLGGDNKELEPPLDDSIPASHFTPISEPSQTDHETPQDIIPTTSSFTEKPSLTTRKPLDLGSTIQVHNQSIIQLHRSVVAMSNQIQQLEDNLKQHKTSSQTKWSDIALIGLGFGVGIAFTIFAPRKKAKPFYY